MLIYALPGDGGPSFQIHGLLIAINADHVPSFCPSIAAELQEKISLKGKMPMDIGLSFLPRSKGEAPLRQAASVPSD